MNIDIKNIIALAFMACAVQFGTECREYILVNEGPEAVTFRVSYKTSNGATYGGDDFKLGRRGGAWRLNAKDSQYPFPDIEKNIRELTVIGNGKSIVVEAIKPDEDNAYGIFFSYENGNPTIKAYDKATTNSKGYKWSDWDSGKR
jgi:hypothetical protein